jgi:glycosyltransferase involved in cell wall biosynthesis
MGTIAERRRPVVEVPGVEPPGRGSEGGGPPYTVTVVIPCFNYGRFVGEAVRSAVRQEGADVRVVVVDDGSTDGRTPRMCDRAAMQGRAGQVRVIHQANAGLPAARNLGAAGATGEYLVFLDADDVLEPDFVAKLAPAARGQGVSHAYCQPRMVGPAEELVWRVPAWDEELLLVTNLHPVTGVVRRECFEAVGGFSEDMREGYEDWDLWLKLAGRGWRGERVAEPLFVYRRHSRSTMIVRAVARHEELYRRIVERHTGLFARHGDSVIARMNDMLRREDMNWLDESGVPIRLLALERQRDLFEAMTAVRAHRAVHGVVSALPRPLARGARVALGAVKRAMNAGR